ncbi:MAG: hypothetical protein CL477_10290 [Acidobacteria bacterium]|jgi:hypothetical protein|nr:hypothetical protein [Acidobacteriota bacterium]MDP7338786.1 DUF4126 domain-containing protein [Vicinamibacterales bacterium]MDP7479104.1 DUF4126 domain-containing protein [Vicinamibacterales bacterium]MDP7692896.1 DUF4126 domain-containing protein [Vicinamibacterales bacterium]HJN43031.1 DUF4126 domain-containing protein [Vicinamibacterales bacterium]|tara:strand:+ start:165 stop:761 length:597 start_codon:yes stop_codon:yes gene_type:complete
MQPIATLGHALGFSMAAGVNVYATVAILGLTSRLGWVELPSQFALFDSNVVIGGALLLYVVEFVADKIPWVDSVWDAVHTLIRPLGGAVIAVASLGEATPMTAGLMALLGGSVAAGAHLTKASTRAAANTSPEPVSNWVLSLAEDGFVVALGILTMTYPVAAFAVTSVLVLLMLLFLGTISRAAWRWLGRRSQAATRA